MIDAAFSLGYIIFIMNEKRMIMSLFLVAFFFLSSSLYSLDTSTDEPDHDGDFSLSVGVDVPLIAAGTILFVSGLFVEPVSAEQQDQDELIFPDKYSIFAYNSGLDSSCDFLFAASLLLPVSIVIGTDFNTILETGVMLMESLVLTYSVKDIMKNKIPRYRPYTYLSPPVDDDYMNSFPSGHTAGVFAVCGFSAYVFSEMYPDSEWKLPVIIGASVIAAATGTLRVVSGNHFITDVAAGALIGSLFGIGVPLLHKSRIVEDTGVDIAISTGEQPAFTISYRI